MAAAETGADDLPTDVRERNGVQYRFVEPYAPRAKPCAGCERWFVASCHRSSGDGDDWCPECREVESLASAVERTLEEAERPPAEVDVDEVFGR